jgi:long-chain acyl-CoA synthetase
MRTLINEIEESINKFWNSKSLSNYKGHSLSYKDVAEKIYEIHCIFHHLKIKPNDKIALLGKNSSNWAITYLATITYHAVIVPILPDFHDDDISHIIKHSQSKLVFLDSNYYDRLDDSEFKNVAAFFLLDKAKLILKEDKKNHEEKIKQTYIKLFKNKIDNKNVTFKDINPENIAVLLYTSGTSGFSKGVLLPHRSLYFNIKYAQKNMPLYAGNSILSFLPLAHAYGCAFEFLFPFTLGVHVTFLGKIPSPKIILRAFSEIKPHLILSVPLIIEKIYQKQIKPVLDQPKMKLLMKISFFRNAIYKRINQKLTESFGNNFREIIIGGAALNNEVEEFLTKIKFKFTVGYGMSECGPLISYVAWDKRIVGSVGEIVDELKIKIDSPNPESGVGEIMVKGSHVMTGYYKNPSVTENTITEDNWLKTGDLGFIDAHNQIHIKGRSKNIILGPSGQNIFPEEIEAKLNSRECIAESLVYEKDNKIIALVYPDYSFADSKNIQEKQMIKLILKNRELINKSLPSFSKISSLKIISTEFEKTPTKKIKRYLYTK